MAKPDFIARDAATIVQEMVADVESRTGKTLFPAQPERLMIDFMAYRESLLREQVQDAALLNLVRYSRGTILDELANDRGENRLEAFHAGCTLQFSVPVPLAVDLPIPAGTIATTTSGALSVASNVNVTLPAGQLSISVKASATDAGILGNGYLPGQIKQLVSILPGAPNDLAVANTTVTDGGAEAETDERLIQRLLLSFDGYSVAGPAAAYRRLAMRAHPSVIDVAVVTHTPGEVTLYLLLDSGLPGQTVIDAVQSGVSDDAVRVLCDTTHTIAAIERPYRVRARLTPNPEDSGSPEAKSAVLTAATNAVQSLANKLASTLSTPPTGDIIPSQFTAALQPLVYRVELLEPEFTSCDKWDWRHCTGIDLTFAEVT